MKPYVVLFVALASYAVATPASAQSTASDAKCLMVSNVFAKAATDPKAREAANLASFFYLGRLDGRLSASQLADALIAQQKGLTAANAGPVMNECNRFMARRSAALQALGQRLDRGRSK